MQLREGGRGMQLMEGDGGCSLGRGDGGCSYVHIAFVGKKICW